MALSILQKPQLNPVIFLALAALFGACAPQKGPAVQVGKTSEQELTKLAGEPTQVDVPESRPQAKVLSYAKAPTRPSYQVENGVVVAQTRSPEAHEMTLQYWRQKWKGQELSYEEIPETRDPHGRAQYQLRSQEARMTVIYDPARDAVIRVVSYAQK